MTTSILNHYWYSLNISLEFSTRLICLSLIPIFTCQTVLPVSLTVAPDAYFMSTNPEPSAVWVYVRKCHVPVCYKYGQCGEGLCEACVYAYDVWVCLHNVLFLSVCCCMLQ